MMYIIEIPHQTPPMAWAANNEDDLISKIDTGNTSYQYQNIPLIELFAQNGVTSIGDAKANNDAGEFDWLIELADEAKGNMNAMVYSDPSSEGSWEIGVLSEFDAMVEYNGHDLSSQHIYMADDEALAAVRDTALWRGHGGIPARIKLIECLADNAIKVQNLV